MPVAVCGASLKKQERHSCPSGSWMPHKLTKFTEAFKTLGDLCIRPALKGYRNLRSIFPRPHTIKSSRCVQNDATIDIIEKVGVEKWLIA
jgi:hypothetical protein